MRSAKYASDEELVVLVALQGHAVDPGEHRQPSVFNADEKLSGPGRPRCAGRDAGLVHGVGCDQPRAQSAALLIGNHLRDIALTGETDLPDPRVHPTGKPAHPSRAQPPLDSQDRFEI